MGGGGTVGNNGVTSHYYQAALVEGWADAGRQLTINRRGEKVPTIHKTMQQRSNIIDNKIPEEWGIGLDCVYI